MTRFGKLGWGRRRRALVKRKYHPVVTGRNDILISRERVLFQQLSVTAAIIPCIVAATEARSDDRVLHNFVSKSETWREALEIPLNVGAIGDISQSAQDFIAVVNIKVD